MLTSDISKRYIKINSIAPDDKDPLKIHMDVTEVLAEECERIAAMSDCKSGVGNVDEQQVAGDGCEIRPGVFLEHDEDESGFWSWLRTYAP